MTHVQYPLPLRRIFLFAMGPIERALKIEIDSAPAISSKIFSILIVICFLVKIFFGQKK